MKKKAKVIVLDFEKDGPEEVLEFDRSELIAEYLEYADLKESDIEAVCFTVKLNDYSLFPPAELPKEALKALSEADVVLFPDGWDRSDCGRFVYGACKLFGLCTYEQDYSSQSREELE